MYTFRFIIYHCRDEFDFWMLIESSTARMLLPLNLSLSSNENPKLLKDKLVILKFVAVKEVTYNILQIEYNYYQ